jgi:hypothetical protein
MTEFPPWQEEVKTMGVSHVVLENPKILREERGLEEARWRRPAAPQGLVFPGSFPWLRDHTVTGEELVAAPGARTA